MPDETTRDEMLVLARRAGLDLPEAYREELIAAWRHVEAIAGRIAAKPRARADEPAHVFAPLTVAPALEG